MENATFFLFQCHDSYNENIKIVSRDAIRNRGEGSLDKVDGSEVGAQIPKVFCIQIFYFSIIFRKKYKNIDGFICGTFAARFALINGYR